MAVCWHYPRSYKACGEHLSFERVQGAVFGAWFEVSELVHILIDQLATNRVIMAGPQSGRSRNNRAREVNSLLKVGMSRRKL